jgi:DNA-binding beta-propeller fold protein YncE
VRIDRDDNIWAVDKGSDMVIKFNQAGRVVWVFGRRKESAEEAEPWEHVTPPLPHVDGLFRQPTDVAFDSDGNIYITDGYINARVAKYDKNGDWVKSWGSHGTGPGQFNTPHAIVIDRNNQIYVGDRGNRRIQVFDAEGNFSICITPGPSQVLFVGESTFPGRVFKVTLEGKVLGVIGRSGRNLGQFSGAHQLACRSENEVYVAETSNWRVQKLLFPARTTTARATR